MRNATYASVATAGVLIVVKLAAFAYTDASASIPKSYQKKAHAQANAKKRKLVAGVVAIVVGLVTIGLLVWLLTTMW